MLQRKIYTLLAAILAFAGVSALAEDAQHHPGAMPAPAVAAPGPGMPQGMPGGSLPGAGAMAMAGMMRMMMGADGMGGMGMMGMAEHVEGRLAFLKTELKVTDAQLPLWNSVAQAIRENAAALHGMRGGMMTGTTQTATLPEKLALREKMMTAHLESLRKLKAAVDPLYAGLTDEQKKTADELFMGPMGMM